MGFDYNPYKHIEIIHRDEPKKVRYNYETRNYEAGWAWYCHNCGGESQKAWPENVDFFSDIVDAFKDHIRKGHDRTPEDFEGWSIY